MRDDNMPVSEVQRQVEAVALAVKQGSSVSDMRHHRMTGKLRGAQVRAGLLSALVAQAGTGCAGRRQLAACTTCLIARSCVPCCLTHNLGQPAVCC